MAARKHHPRDGDQGRCEALIHVRFFFEADEHGRVEAEDVFVGNPLALAIPFRLQRNREREGLGDIASLDGPQVAYGLVEVLPEKRQDRLGLNEWLQRGRIGHDRLRNSAQRARLCQRPTGRRRPRAPG